MKFLKYTLILFFIVDFVIFVISQTKPDLLVSMFPQFGMDNSIGNSYPRLVGILFLALGIARLYGGLFIREKGAFIVSIWSWVIELVYIISELANGEFIINENLLSLIFAPLMLFWSIIYYKEVFETESL